MRRINVFCGGLSVKYTTTIAVLMDYNLNPQKLQRETRDRLRARAKMEKLSFNSSHLVVEIAADPTHTGRMFITFPPSLPDIEEHIIAVLRDIEEAVAESLERERMRGLLADEDHEA